MPGICPAIPSCIPHNLDPFCNFKTQLSLLTKMASATSPMMMTTPYQEEKVAPQIAWTRKRELFQEERGGFLKLGEEIGFFKGAFSN